jgi:hypothetical protein
MDFWANLYWFSELHFGTIGSLRQVCQFASMSLLNKDAFPLELFDIVPLPDGNTAISVGSPDLATRMAWRALDRKAMQEMMDATSLEFWIEGELLALEVLGLEMSTSLADFWLIFYKLSPHPRIAELTIGAALRLVK